MNHIICIKSALAADILPKIVFVSCEQVIEAFLNNCVPTITDLWGWMRTELNCSTFLKTTPPPSLACRWAKLRCFGAATQSQADCLGNLITAYFWRMPLSLSRIKGRWICEWAYHLERLGTIWIVLSSYFFTEQRGEEALRGVSQSQTSSGLRATAMSSHLESAYIKAVNYCHSPRATVSLVLIEITYCLLRTEARNKTVIRKWNIHACGAVSLCLASSRQSAGMWVNSVICGWTTRRKAAESYSEVRGFPLNHSKIPSYLLQCGSSSWKC